ncbi:hypothetical protein PCANC_12373 [Puccinia coronata f. sp. avenae]|uniref:Uncharacterized protein n=1 Tax=Puccinia coronata f. sp. avenae TaxID=200324 RepID=A0A2N5T5E9_9BASI|nr:hypothetical protein PCASD_17440 [Puccinia coronata f. sp. avenae]PLW41156.1 hypothetical protein PCANC_12373 [Puccinia coronata f. sp. avenae]PLW50297.1 hypothetical protein PCASD_01681 [Puccinia coronata f. sp. avenae]
MLPLRVLLITCALMRPTLSRPTSAASLGGEVLRQETQPTEKSNLAQKIAASAEFKLDTASPNGAPALPSVKNEEDKGVLSADRSESDTGTQTSTDSDSSSTDEISAQESAQVPHSEPQHLTDLDLSSMGDTLQQNSAQVPNTESSTSKNMNPSSTSDSAEQKSGQVPHTESSTSKGLDSSSTNDTSEKSVEAPCPARFSEMAAMYRKRTWGHYHTSHRYGTLAGLAAGYLAHSKYSDESMGFEMDFITALCSVGAYFMTNSLYSEWSKFINK